MQKRRAAVVGVGYLGNFHAQKYKALSQKPEMNVDLVAVCDLNESQVQKVAQDLSVTPFMNPQDLLGRVDLVTIATITPTHFQLAKMFLENKIHVNVEKPLCLESKEGWELVQLARRNNVTLCVGHSERFNPAFQELRTQLKKPKFIELNRYAPFKSRGSEVSAIHDLMIHDLDLMRCFDSSPARLLTASAGRLATDTYDWCSAGFSFESGLVVQVNCSRLSKEMTRTIRALDQDQTWLANLQTGEVERTFVTNSKENPVAHELRNMGRGDNLLSETEAFLSAIDGKPSPAVFGEDGVEALKLVESILTQIHSHRGS